jgi:hypothetical protein
MENSNDTIWNRTSDLPICNTVKHVIGGKIVGKKRRGRRKQLMDDLNDREFTGIRKRKHQILLCGELAFGKGYGPVERHPGLECFISA